MLRLNALFLCPRIEDRCYHSQMQLGSSAISSQDEDVPLAIAGQYKDVPLASEFNKLGLLLTVCTALNREDGYPTFTGHPKEKFLWREAKKIDYYSTVLDDATNILVLDHQVLACMATGDSAFVLASSSDPGINHEGEVYPDAPDLGQCAVMRDGVDHWAKIKAAGNVGLTE